MARQSRQKRTTTDAKRAGGGARRPGAEPARKEAAGFGWTWPIVFGAVVIAGAGGATWFKFQHGGRDGGVASAKESARDLGAAATEVVVDNTGPEAGYVGSASCAECHQGIAESFSHIAMGRSLYPPTSENIIEDYSKANEFFHEASGQYFRMTHEGDNFYQTSFQKAPDGSVINEKKVQVSYVVGSGNHSRSYVHREPDGKMYQLPVAWYPQENIWAMNPGYDSPHHINFSRRITYDCMFCHAALPDLPAGADQFNYGESAFFPEKLEAINCERCHGPAQKHVTLAKGGAAEAAVRAAIVNPGNLENKLQLEVCMQCHLETTSGKLPHSVHTVGKGIYGYRPGEPLEEYRYAFNHPEGTGHDDKFEIAGQAYRMRMSQCFIKSEGRMTCTTCHDPHRVPKDRIAAGIQSCLECHASMDCTEPMEVRMPVKDNCIQCHMPQRRTDDVVHVTMTDHFIQRRPPPAEELVAPKKEYAADYHGDVEPYYPKEIKPEVRDLYLGLAHISNSADLEKGIDHLDKYLAQNSDEFAPTYTRGVALKLLGRLDQAREDLERAVELKPNQPQAWMALGDLFEMMRNYERSIDCYQTAIKISPNLSRAHNGAGTSMMLSGDMKAAEAAFRKAALLDPFDENPHLNLAGILLRRGELGPAEAEARAALAINPNRPDGWGQLAQCALGSGRSDEAIWTSLQALKLDGGSEPIFDSLVSACRTAGADGAMKSLQNAEKRAPFAAHVMEALISLQRNDVGAADAALAGAAGETTAAAAMPMAVRVALHVNRRDLALVWGAQACAAMPDNDEALIRYAAALRAAGQAGKARSMLEESLGKSRSPRVLNALAWLYATADEPELRNGPQAAALADESAASLGQANVFVLQSQAAAAAELGDFGRATTLAGQALEMARDAKLGLEVGRIERQLADYQAGRAHKAQW